MWVALSFWLPSNHSEQTIASADSPHRISGSLHGGGSLKGIWERELVHIPSIEKEHTVHSAVAWGQSMGGAKGMRGLLSERDMGEIKEQATTRKQRLHLVRLRPGSVWMNIPAVQGHPASSLSMKKILNGLRKQCILWTVERSLQSLLAPDSMKEVQQSQNSFQSAFVWAFHPALCRR